MQKLIHTKKMGLVRAFHGCDLSLVQGILDGTKKLAPSKASKPDGSDAYHWLGDGIYFWEDDSTRALEWAEQQKKLGKIKTPAVIGVEIDLGVCMNLLARPYLEQLRQTYKVLEDGFRIQGKTLPKNEPAHSRDKDEVKRYLDYLVVESTRKLAKIDGVEYDTLRAVFWEGHDLYPGAGFRDRNHIQICVVNPEVIRGYFLPA